MRKIGLAIVGVALCAAPASGFERGSQADYDMLAYCYVQHAGAANAMADDHEQWVRVYPNPDAGQAEMIASALAMAEYTAQMASLSAEVFEDLDHPGYEMDFVSVNKAYDKGYAFWADYMALPFIDRKQIGYTESDLGMSEACWGAILAIETLHAANIGSGELVWDE